MAVSVHIPSLFCRQFGTARVETVRAGTLGEMVAVLDKRFPGLGEQLLDPDGSLRRWVNVFVGDVSIPWDCAAVYKLELDALVRIVSNVA
ncbi:MAG: hypothetical protein WBA34_00405 [Candidatus Deferrimicrobiaceae bacterium]